MGKGIFYEKKGAAFLRLSGYKILQKNVRSRFGEIDIIAQDKAFIVFVEVKARSKDYLVSGKEAMTKNKIEKIKKTALFYAGKNLERFYRFDVLEIIQGKFWRQYDLLKGAFDYTIEDYRQPL